MRLTTVVVLLLVVGVSVARSPHGRSADAATAAPGAAADDADSADTQTSTSKEKPVATKRLKCSESKTCAAKKAALLLPVKEAALDLLKSMMDNMRTNIGG